jgi:hypothetical protein
LSSNSVHLDGPKDYSNKDKRGNEANRARQQSKQEAHDERPTKVEHSRHKAEGKRGVRFSSSEKIASSSPRHGKLRRKVQNTVQEHVDGRGRRREERPPPPAVVFRAKVEVAHEDRYFRAGQDEDRKDEEQEAEDVVDPVVPDAVHDKVELNEDGTERQHTAHEHRRNGLQIVSLLGDLARDLVGAAGVLNAL